MKSVKDKIKKTVLLSQRAILALKHLENAPRTVYEYYFSDGPVTVRTRQGEVLCIRNRRSGDLPALLSLLEKGYKIHETNEKNYIIDTPCYLYVSKIVPGWLRLDYHKMYIEPFTRIDPNFFNGINVLDVGGYRGETMLLFKMDAGCEKVLVVEPVEENLEYIKENAKLNNIERDVIIIPRAVSEHTGRITIKSENPPGTTGFGHKPGVHKITLKSISWNDLLEHAVQEGVSFAKVDCEGGERYLLRANPDLIKSIPYWVIEVHSRKIEDEIKSLFSRLGFKHLEETDRLNNNTSTHAFTNIPR